MSDTFSHGSLPHVEQHVLPYRTDHSGPEVGPPAAHDLDLDWELFGMSTKAQEHSVPYICQAGNVGYPNLGPAIVEANEASRSLFPDLADGRPQLTPSDLEVWPFDIPDPAQPTTSKGVGSHCCKDCGSNFDDCFKLR